MVTRRSSPPLTSVRFTPAGCAQFTGAAYSGEATKKFIECVRAVRSALRAVLSDCTGHFWPLRALSRRRSVSIRLVGACEKP
jgi:hypothetical protein